MILRKGSVATAKAYVFDVRLERALPGDVLSVSKTPFRNADLSAHNWRCVSLPQFAATSDARADRPHRIRLDNCYRSID